MKPPIAPDKELKKTIAGAVRFLEEGGQTAQAFRDSLSAGGLIVEDLLIVAGATTALLGCGLTREALVMLITAKCKRAANGSRLAESTVDLVLDAMAHLDEHLIGPKTGKAP